MSRTSFLVSCLAIAGMFLAAGCSPTSLGDTERAGAPPKTLITTDKASELLKSSKLQMTSKGEALDIKITMASGETCETNQKLQEMVKNWPILPWSQPAHLVYSGNWQQNLGSDCLQMIQAPGGSYVEVQVSEDRGLFDDRLLTFCTKQDMSDLTCKSNLTYTIPLVEGVDN